MTKRDAAFEQRQAEARARPGLKAYPIREDGRRPILLFRSLSDGDYVRHKTPRWWIYDEILDRWHVGRAGKSKWVELNVAIGKWDLDWDEFNDTRHCVVYKGVEAGTAGAVMTVVDCRLAAEYRAKYPSENEEGLVALVNLTNRTTEGEKT